LSGKSLAIASRALAGVILGPAARGRGMNNLKQIGLGWHYFFGSHGRFPANIVNSDGKPLLSWRVAILPYIEQEKLYAQFHLDEPWDSEHNMKLLNQMPSLYRRSTSRAPRNHTTYLTPVGKQTALAGNEQGLTASGANELSREQKSKGIRIVDITDGTSNTL